MSSIWRSIKWSGTGIWKSSRSAAAVKTILGTPIGTAGTGLYSGKTLVAGIDFTGTSAASMIATPAAPKNPLWAARTYGTSGAYVRNQDQAGLLKNQYDPDIGYSGFADQNGGIPITFDNGAPQQVLSLADSTGTGGNRTALRLHACRQSTAEQAVLNTGNSNQIERGAMAHTLGSLWWCAPATIRTRGTIPTGPVGWHPTIWSLQVPGNAWCYNGSEHGFECNATTYTSAYEDPHTSGTTGSNAGTVNFGMTYRDGNPHDWVWDEASNSVITYSVDGSQVNQLTSTKSLTANPSYALWTSHIVSGFQGENYSAGAWATAGASGANLDIFGMQVWVPTGGQLYTPQTTISDLLCTPGQTISFTLPSATALWGSAVTDQVFCHSEEQEEPGNSATGWTGATAGVGFPAWLSYNSGTRTLSGTVPTVGSGVNVSGSLNIVVGYCPSGNACVPATFRIIVAPAFVGATSAALLNGQSGSIDLYAAWDVGRNFVVGAANKQQAKTITATGIPPGMSLGSNGLVSGSPTTNGSYTITTTATNSAGQMSTQNISVTVQAASTAVAAPSGITSATLIGSYDPADASTVTTAGSVVTALAKSSLDTSTGPTLANASTGPTLVNRTDLAGNSRNVLRFTSASSQYLQVFNSTWATISGATIVVIAEHATTAASQAIVDITNGAANVNTNRHVLLSSTATGMSHRKGDNGGVSSNANTGSIPFATGLHLQIGRSPSGAGTFAQFNLDGQGTAVTAGSSSGQPSSLAYFTLGAARASNAQANFFDGYVHRVLIYNGPLTDAEVESIAVWANTNYGTANNA